MGAPYHSLTNEAAERLIQTFKQTLRKSFKSPKAALVEFLMHYRRTQTSSGYSPSELLNSKQMPTIVDTLLPSPFRMAQSKMKKPNKTISKLSHQFQVGDACYASYFGPRRNQDPRWVPAIIVKRQGTRMFNARVVP